MVPLVLNTWLPMISPPYMWTDWWIACSVWGPRLIEQSTPKYRAGPSLKGLPPLTAPYYQVPCGFWNRNLGMWYEVHTRSRWHLCQIIGRLGLNQCSHPANQTDLSSPIFVVSSIGTVSNPFHGAPVLHPSEMAFNASRMVCRPILTCIWDGV